MISTVTDKEYDCQEFSNLTGELGICYDDSIFSFVLASEVLHHRSEELLSSRFTTPTNFERFV